MLLLLLVTAKGKGQIFRFVWAPKKERREKKKAPLAVTGARPCKCKCVCKCVQVCAYICMRDFSKRERERAGESVQIQTHTHTHTSEVCGRFSRVVYSLINLKIQSKKRNRNSKRNTIYLKCVHMFCKNYNN